jgi:hypothetical protein
VSVTGDSFSDQVEDFLLTVAASRPVKQLVEVLRQHGPVALAEAIQTIDRHTLERHLVLAVVLLSENVPIDDPYLGVEP